MQASPSEVAEVRSSRAEVRAPGWLRAGFALSDQLAPALSARWAQRLLFTPRKRPPRPAQRSFLEAATRFDIDTKHGRVAAYSWGNHGETVVLAHGWSGHAGQWSGLVPALCEAGFRAIALDMPGHGASQGELSSAVLFADALGTLTRIAGTAAAVVAHSLGAAGVTLALARGQLETRRAVFISAPSQLEPYWARFRQVLGMSRRGWDTMQASAEVWLGVPFSAVDPLSHAANMNVPLLLIHDNSDREIPISDARQLASAWPGAMLVETQQLGHYSILTDASTIGEAVTFVRA